MKKKFFFCFFRNKTATTTTENVTLFRKIKIERSYKEEKKRRASLQTCTNI